MKNLILVLVVFLSNNAFADSCSDAYYSEVPNLVEELVGNLYAKPGKEVIGILEESFREVVGDFAKVTSLVISIKDFDGENVIYHVVENHDMGSAVGGSEYAVMVNSVTGVAEINSYNCW